MRNHNAQAGNAFIFIFLGVILFAALVFVFSRGLDTGATRMTAARSRTAASDIINYAQAIERATNRVLQNGVSENDVSFENGTVTGYTHTPAAADKAKVFNSSTGGGMDFMTPSEGQSVTNAPWLFTGDVVVTGQADDSLSDLIMVLPVSYDVCLEINKQLNAGIDLGSAQGTKTVTKYIGTFADVPATAINPGTGIAAGCFSGLIKIGAQTGDYTFFKVLIAR